MKVSKDIFRKLLRVYGHIYFSHMKDIELNKSQQEHLDRSFEHFYWFIKQFGLVDPMEMVPLQARIDKIAPKGEQQ